MTTRHREAPSLYDGCDEEEYEMKGEMLLDVDEEGTCACCGQKKMTITERLLSDIDTKFLTAIVVGILGVVLICQIPNCNARLTAEDNVRECYHSCTNGNVTFDAKRQLCICIRE